MKCDCCGKDFDSLIGGIGETVCQSCFDWLTNPHERRKNCGNRWYDIDRGAFVWTVCAFTLFGVAIGFVLGKWVF